MNEMQKDNFDMLISAAVVQCVHHDADNLSSVDTSDVPDTSRLYKKVMRNLPGSRRTAVKAIVTLVLAAALLALTACACLPEIRDYVWGVVTEWYGDHFEVSFEKESMTTEDFQTSDLEVETPKTIEQVADLTYLPDGCLKVNELSLAAQNITEYIVSDEWGFIFGQSTYDKTDSFVDGEKSRVLYIQVNGCDGVMTEEIEDGIAKYFLIWQDGQYRYYLQGNFPSVSELIRIAESVSFK